MYDLKWNENAGFDYIIFHIRIFIYDGDFTFWNRENNEDDLTRMQLLDVEWKCRFQLMLFRIIFQIPREWISVLVVY